MVPALSIACLAACEDGTPGTHSGFEVVDSAGIELVRNLDPAVDTLSSELIEVLRLGTVDGPEETQFHLIRDIALDAAGRLFITDLGSQSVRVFTPDGRFVRRFGGAGRGPGQFASISGLVVWRDTVHVMNASGPQASFFDTAGAHLRSYTNLLPNGSRIRLLAGGTDGWYVADDSLFGRQGREEVGVVRQTPTAIRRLDLRLLDAAVGSREAADSLLAQVVTYPGSRYFGMIGSEGGSERFVVGNRPFFEPVPSHAIDARGHVYVAPGWPYVINVYDRGGTLVRRITRAHESVPVTADLIAQVLRRAKSHYDTTSQQSGATYHTWSERARMPVPGFLPVLRSVRVSPDGWLWVRRVDVHADPVAMEWTTGEPPSATVWDVFDPDGVFRRTVRLPPRFTPLVVLADGVIGIGRDELDVQYVVRYEVRLREAR